MDNNNNNTNNNNNNNQVRKSFLFQQDIAPGAITQDKLVSNPRAKGDLYYGLDGVRFTRVGIGKVGQVLTVSSGVPVWQYLLTTGLATSRPTSGSFTGVMFFSTDTFVLSIYTGSAWKAVTLT